MFKRSPSDFKSKRISIGIACGISLVCLAFRGLPLVGAEQEAHLAQGIDWQHVPAGWLYPQPDQLSQRVTDSQATAPLKQPGVTLTDETLFSRQQISFPYRYTLTGQGDLSWRLLAKRFYDRVDWAAKLAAANPDISEAALVPGTAIDLPEPASLPPYPVDQLIELAFHRGFEQDEQGAILVNEAEFELFTRILATESGPGWSAKGIQMIAETLTNRARAYHLSLYEVITQPGQFDVIANGRYQVAEVTDEIKAIAREALKKNRYLKPSTLFFCTQEAYRQTPWFHKLHIDETFENTVFMSRTPDSP